MKKMIRGGVLVKGLLLALCIAVAAPAFAAPLSTLVDNRLSRSMTTINPFTLDTVTIDDTSNVTMLMADHTLNSKGARVFTLSDGETTVTLRPRQVISPYKPIFRSDWCVVQ